MSFRTRLVLAAAYLVAAVVLALEIPLALSIERRADSDFQTDVLGRAALLAARISDEVAAANQGAPSASTGALTEAVDAAAAAVDERIVVTNDRGRLLVDSAGQAAPGSKFATAERPEFGVALAEGRVDSRRRFSETAGRRSSARHRPGRRRGRGRRRGAGVVLPGVRRRPRAPQLASSCGDRARGRGGCLRARLDPGHDCLAAAQPVARHRGELGGGRPRRARPDRRPGRARGAGRFLQPHGRRARLEHARPARLRRERVAPAPHPADRDQASARGDPGRRRGGRRERGESGGGARPSRGARGRPARARRRGDPPPAGTPSTSPRWPRTRSSGGRLPRANAEKTVAAGRLRAGARLCRSGRPRARRRQPDRERLRYTPPGAQVTVESGVGERPARHSSSPTTDPGSPKRTATRVFERFYRGSNGRRLGPGTGLGLAIVAELVERWDGEVTLADGPGTRMQVAFRQTPADR